MVVTVVDECTETVGGANDGGGEWGWCRWCRGCGGGGPSVVPYVYGVVKCVAGHGLWELQRKLGMGR